jgi:hypothetical protein
MDKAAHKNICGHPARSHARLCDAGAGRAQAAGRAAGKTDRRFRGGMPESLAQGEPAACLV